MKPKATACELAADLEHEICSVVSKLKRHYAEDALDRPDSWLPEHPDATRITEALKVLLDALLPGRLFSTEIRRDEHSVFLVRRLSEAWRLLRPELEKALPFRWRGAAAVTEGRSADAADVSRTARKILRDFLARLPEVRALLVEDIRAAYEGDPAALSYSEVQLAYPAVLAIASHRLAHELYRADVPIVPRVMSEWTHARTGIDIHPGAQIGRGFFIDHGTGVVIGETCRIGDRVKLYQGVTLGARSFPLDQQGHPIKHIQRHPTVEDDVVIYAHATILGGDTVIGAGSTIGGNVFLMESVPPGSQVAMEHTRVRIQPAARRRAAR